MRSVDFQRDKKRNGLICPAGKELHLLHAWYRNTSFTQQMIKKFDSKRGRFLYSRRMGIVEPVFGNIRNSIGLKRFTLRGKIKVDIQWKLFCIVHNLQKVFRYSTVFAQ
jgi:hypothetical protein